MKHLSKIYVKKNITLVLIFIIISTLGLSSRLNLLENHFSHIDDIGVAKTIIERNQDYESLKENIEFKKKTILTKYKNNKFINILNNLEKINILNHIILSKFFLDYKVNPVPKNWTYAPSQFYLTNLLINEDLNYNQLKIAGRTPSLILNLLSILILYFVLKKIYLKNNFKISFLICSTLIFLSWENIIYSSQMSNYGSSYFCFFSIILIYINCLSYKNKNVKNFFFIWNDYRNTMHIPLPTFNYMHTYFIFTFYKKFK